MNTPKLFASAFLFSILLSGCGVWRDFTTYFNTYYNAKTLFDQTEEEILRQKKDIFVFREEVLPGQLQQATQPTTYQQQLAQRQSFQQNPQQLAQQTGAAPFVSMVKLKEDLTKVIEKCSKILQFDKESSFFDDALFITGKSFYYQEEYARAQRKFLELATIPESKYSLENKLWLGKTYLQLREFEKGLALIDEVKKNALEEEEEEIFESAAITKIGFYVYREEYQNAINECQLFLKQLNSDETIALVWYQMGKIYLKQNDKENALNAYSSVLKYSPTFEIEFESRMEHALILKDLNRYDESEDEFDKLRNEGKFVFYLDRILVELGKIYNDINENDLALRTFVEVDTTYRMTQSSGIASYMIGKIYEEKFGNYDSSYKYYNKAASSLAPYEMKMESGARARDIDKYYVLKNTIRKLDLDKIYISTPTRFVQDSIDYDLAYKEFQDEVKQLAAKNANTNTNTDSFINTPEMERQKEMQAQQSLFQQTQLEFNKRRLEDRVSLKTLIILNKATKPERPKMKPDSINGLLAQNYYNLGSLFFSELEVHDSAFYYYDKIVSEYSDSSVLAKTYYALGTYFETQDNKEKADSLFQIIYKGFPKDPLYNEVARKLGYIKEEKKKVIVASNDPAEPDYIAAEQFYYDKKYRQAIESFKDLYLKYPTSSFAPKSFYYIGLIYEENLKLYDSAAVYYQILSSKEYAGTPYGKAVMAKYTEYKNEKDRIEKEKQDKEEAERQKAEQANAAKEKAAPKKEIKQAVEQEELNDEVKFNTKKDSVIGEKPIPESQLPDSLLTPEQKRRKEFLDQQKKEVPDSTEKKVIK